MEKTLVLSFTFNFFRFSACLFIFSISSSLYCQPQDSIRVLVFLAESCPICRNVTPELNRVYTQFNDKGISFLGVFPNRASTPETRKLFQQKFSLSFPLIADEERMLTQKWDAKITPEVFVIRIKDEKILYRGKVDNSYETLGRRRTVVTEHFLFNALSQWLKGLSPDPEKTTAVGCFIADF
jgi:peroxiredoxin